MANVATGGFTCPGNFQVFGNTDCNGDLNVDGVVQGFSKIQLAAVDGAITIEAATVVFTKAGIAAMTLAAPSAAQNGLTINFTSATANAHTVTATGLLQDGVTGGAKDVAAFEAFAGASLTLMAYEAKWHVISKNACTITTD